MPRKAHAFTLIELLVVIAIIAILAAILFPVFAQAKAAAKASASLSNTKQLTLGVIMYSGDNEDNNPIATTWNTGSDQLQFGAGLAFSTWGWVTQPYLKNSSIFLDPLAPPNSPISGIPQRNIDTYYTQYGYNYVYLSPDTTPGGPGSPSAASTTSFAKPAETVMLASKFAAAENTSPNVWGTAFPGGALADATVDAPACFNIPMWCMYGWGVDGGSPWASMMLNEMEGLNTGGVSSRAAQKAVVSWLDGHSKNMSVGALAVGTNWTPTAPAGVDITNTDTYLWDNL